MTRTQERTLSYVNRLRVAVGMKPLKKLKRGQVLYASRCPIAMSLNGIGSCYGRQIVIHDEVVASKLAEAGFKFTYKNEVQGPRYLDQFVSAFDNGRYPELVA